MSVPWITVLRSSARVSASRSNPSSRDHRPIYIDGAYCAWRPPIRSSMRGSGEAERSSSPWRASSARLSARAERTRSVTRGWAGPAARGRRRRSGGLGRRARAGAGLEAGDELVEAELLEALRDRVELAGAELDEAAGLLAELERLAEPGLARVEAAYDLLDARAGGLVGEGGSVAHDPSPYGWGRTDTVPSWSLSVSSACSRAAAADVTGSPAGSSTSA